MAFIKKHFLTLTGIIAGTIAGYLHWSTIGCTSGSCPITSDPINSTVYGAVMGGLVFNLFQKENK